MRVLHALALSTIGILAGVAAAAAADLPRAHTTGVQAVHHDANGVRAAPLVIYDYEPGVIVRAYWLPPWRNRHFYPITGRVPKSGRHERLSRVSAPPPRAQSYARSWSNYAAFAYERPLVFEQPWRPQPVQPRPAPEIFSK